MNLSPQPISLHETSAQRAVRDAAACATADFVFGRLGIMFAHGPSCKHTHKSVYRSKRAEQAGALVPRCCLKS